jgi:hypothetical protein
MSTGLTIALISAFLLVAIVLELLIANARLNRVLSVLAEDFNAWQAVKADFEYKVGIKQIVPEETEDKKKKNALDESWL